MYYKMCPCNPGIIQAKYVPMLYGAKYVHLTQQDNRLYICFPCDLAIEQALYVFSSVRIRFEK